ncbi:4477_t:CDS:2 [Funneliformis geosporum]|uniref:16536_t:CDS:1 n=1 Tax=Funneliformis geosporum TaxID=1117311 RepID=A0A9W4X010_9GLOM|nr:4477_t:CDS:2 [Funneliformis geosporum]CAI2185117.1 16536_t:CDS:2 [Funneliformis geosporum]
MAFCKCGQNIKLRYPYNDDYVKRHIKNGSCKWISQNREITYLFQFAESRNTLFKKRFACIEVIRKSKWHIERETVRNTKCEIYTSNISEICSECVNINNDQVFWNALNKKPIKPSNIKHTPKIILNENPISKFLFNKDISILMEILGTQNSECQESFWFKLGELGEYEAFKKKAVFEGLCEVMVKAAECQEAGKGLQNLTYSEKIQIL